MPTLTLRGSSTQRYGTMVDPVPWEIPVGGALLPRQSEVSFLLSYDTLPSSTVYEFTLNRNAVLRIDRISDDRYASAVGVALYDTQRRRIGTLVSSADGTGETYELPAGTYRVIASNHLPETVPITLRAQASLQVATLRGSAGTVTGPVGIDSSTVAGSDSIATNAEALQQGTLLGYEGSELSAAERVGSGGLVECVLLGVAERAPSVQELSILTAGGFVPLESGGQAGAGASLVLADESEALAATVEFVDEYGAAFTGVDPLDYDRTVHRRSDFEMLVSLRNPDDSPMDLDGFTIEVQLWDELGETYYGDLTILDSPGPGVIYALLPTALSLTLPEVVIMRTYLTDGSGGVAYPLRGRWTLIEGYTA